MTHQLSRTGYTDSLVRTVPGAGERPAIEWARAILESAPIALRTGLTPGWHALGLELGSRHAPDHVLGWPVVVDTAGEVVLGAHSRLGMDARLAISVSADELSFATAIRFLDLRTQQVLWRAIALPHRVIVGRLVDHAVREHRSQ